MAGVKTRWLDDDEQRTWRAYLWTTRLLGDALDRQLQRDAGMPYTYYMILATLSEVPDRRMSMTDLATLVYSSPSRLSHAAARLEERDWVRRSPHPDNRRVTVAELTDDGFAALAEAAPAHVEEVRKRLFDPLTDEQVVQLREIMRALWEGLDSAPDRPGPFPGVFGPES
ncbi:MarR family winged helix-turn-helix transcriptional regulator [Streptomyces litchfieldiae]|uniref:MarR family transcriptional regulator n=1 Tax=Streptomyces litchfieldiae TaxID=3075543 RepID=A0ABU2MIQ1_9ACTN|nr:MarR family transcriptional regulator [Streptomyces sp. DSM 44938]MDT0341480.1 MarR family transcriptional regulator [Streptomyces sp. DSM 44938]